MDLLDDRVNHDHRSLEPAGAEDRHFDVPCRIAFCRKTFNKGFASEFSVNEEALVKTYVDLMQTLT